VTKDKELSSLVDIRNAVLKLHELGYEIQWTLYGPKIYQAAIEANLTAPPVITYGGYFPIEMKQILLSTADLLLLPINFDVVSQRYVGYSFQTKVPEYMASGSPTLVYGPPTNPNVRYARKFEWAAVVDQQDEGILIKTLLKLMNDVHLRSKLGLKAREIAFKNHNSKVVRSEFQSLIRQISMDKDRT
jgi:glycosyltransferase involved in cell wall biosynthesis